VKINEMFPRKFVSGDDLNGKSYVVTIEEVRQEQLRIAGAAKEETRYVLYLLNTRKGIILSRTLAEQIADIVGRADTADWPRHKIVIYPVPMLVAGKKRVAIRARALNEVAEPTAEMEHEEEEE